MKTKNWTIIVLAFFIVTIGNATEFPKLNVVSLEDEKALITFEQNSPSRFEISILNKEGTLVYYKKSTSRQIEYQHEFDFSKFRNGKYTVCLNYGNRSISRELNVLKNKIEVGPLRRCYEPYYNIENGKLKVSYLNVACKNVYLNIYKDGHLISGTKLGKELTVQRILNLRNLEDGEYEIVLSDWFKDHKSVVVI